MEGGKYEGKFQKFVDSFRNTDFDSPYWFGLKAMKKITKEATVDLDIYYVEENRHMRHDVFHNFVILDDEYRMTYSSHAGNERGGISLNIDFCVFPFFD